MMITMLQREGRSTRGAMRAVSKSRQENIDKLGIETGWLDVNF
jgi:hypothetical protein